MAAAALPYLVVNNLSPSRILLNQALACALWGGFVAMGAVARSSKWCWGQGCCSLLTTNSYAGRSMVKAASPTVGP